MESPQFFRSCTRTAPKIALLNLPQEIRNEIIYYLRASDLSRFTQSCRTLYDSHGSGLYTNIAIAAPLNAMEGDDCTLSGPSPHTRLLTRTISQDTSKGRQISSFSLQRFNAWYDSIEPVLNKTSNLSSLHLDFLLSQHDSFGSDLIDTATIPHHIHAVRNTLTTLKITYSVSIQGNVAPRITGYCSFKSLPRLKSLEIPWCILFGNRTTNNLPCSPSTTSPAKQIQLSDVLPPSLTQLKFIPDGSLFSKTRFTFTLGTPYLVPQELKILWPAQTMYDMLDTFLADEAWRMYTPALEEISADMFDMRDDQEWKMLTGQNFGFLEETERDFEELIRSEGLRCEAFRLHPSLLLEEGFGEDDT